MPKKEQSEKNIMISSDNNEPAVKRAHIDISLVIAVLSFILAAFSFLFSTLPQLNPFNYNLVERANAGDLKSQIMLADHYYEIADAAESIYWYKMASAQESQYQAALLNNLACVYVNSSPLLEWDTTTIIKAYKTFLKAGELGEIAGYRNAYILIHVIPEELALANGISSAYRSWLYFELTEDGAYTQDLENIVPIEFVGYYEELSETLDDFDEYELYPVIDNREIIKERPDGTTYKSIEQRVVMAVYKKLDEVELPEYTYIHDILDSH